MAPSINAINGDHHHEFDNSALKAEMPEELDVTETETSDSADFLTEHNDENDTSKPSMVNGEDWNHITKPGAHDVLLGRGGGTVRR